MNFLTNQTRKLFLHIMVLKARSGVSVVSRTKMAA